MRIAPGSSPGAAGRLEEEKNKIDYKTVAIFY
jgi:hypothetical protein